MTVLWHCSDLVTATGGELVGPTPETVSGISIDSRSIESGNAFVAISGDRFDGHDFAANAIEAGGTLAIVERSKANRPDLADCPLLVVDCDPLIALERLAMAARNRSQARFIAVTGSVGKTGTKEMLRTVFSAIGKTHAPVGSFNNHWGVPLTLARLPEDAEFAVFEIGMNHADEIRPLSKLVRPEVAIITTVERVHAENFETETDIAEAKAEVFDGFDGEATAILNRDNKWFELLSARARARQANVLAFGEDPSADIRVERTNLNVESSVVQADVVGQAVTYRLGAPGRHLVQNSLAVLGAVHAVGANMTKAVLAFAKFRVPSGRGEQFALLHPAGEFTLIDESYNANPASMRAALALLGDAPVGARGRRIAVLGDMLELGIDAEDEHIGLNEPINEAKTDRVFLVGPIMKNLWEDLPDGRRGAYAETVEDLKPILLGALGPGDVVMVKASFGTGLSPLVEAMKRQFGSGTL